MPSESFNYYVEETNRLERELKQVRQNALDEAINAVVDVYSSCFGNSLMSEGYREAKKDIIKAIKELKNAIK